ncbi:MAG: HWE histidine kinase domain-containing protein [Rhodospirillales bacterium]|nr:HWE histidine kinase domain-containing protein [Rhodospirillales bacterium]
MSGRSGSSASSRARGNHYRVKRELRDGLLFATHSLLRDPPFGRLDLVSCRNLLIYLDHDVQQQTCALFHYALRHNGYLFLGPSESADNPPNLFRALDRKARIYQSIGRPSEAVQVLPHLFGRVRREPRLLHAEYPERGASYPPREASWHRQALERLAPPSILVDVQHRVRHLSETAGRYLQPSAGPLSSDIGDLVRREMRFDLRAALDRAFEKGESTLSLPIAVQFNGHPQLVHLQVRPVADDDGASARQAIVFFIEGGRPARERIDDSGDGAADENRSEIDVVRQLQEELALTQNLLKTTREESEGATEELRAANEELQSINEEYRSTSEELETSKEELQSVNEELQTVNAELKTKLESVTVAHNDLQNLMAATDVGVLFLDPSLRIKRFTPRITELFNITAADEGRPITDFSHRLVYDEIVSDAGKVLRDLALIEHEVQSRSGFWYLMRLRPYRTLDDRIDGVVVTFIDITGRRQVEIALRESEERLRQMIQLVEMSGEPICVWDFDDGIVEWNRGSEMLFGYARDEMVGREKHVVLSTTLPGSGSFEDIKQDVVGNGSWNGELVHRTKDGRKLVVEARIELFPLQGRRLVLETNHDVTERKSWERHQQLLLNELTHRVRNILSVVKSMSYQTMRSSRTLEDFGARFDGRIDALANTHKLLVDANWRGAELEALARSQLAAYVMGQPDRLRLDGPAIVLPAHRAGPFGLVLHELATNAAKYGAWSEAKGRVELTWQMQGKRHALIVWRERDGPAVAAPEALGFGSSLIRRSLAGARVEHEFAPDGVICAIGLPLTDADVEVD